MLETLVIALGGLCTALVGLVVIWAMGIAPIVAYKNPPEMTDTNIGPAPCSDGTYGRTRMVGYYTKDLWKVLAFAVIVAVAVVSMLMFLSTVL